MVKCNHFLRFRRVTSRCLCQLLCVVGLLYMVSGLLSHLDLHYGSPIQKFDGLARARLGPVHDVDDQNRSLRNNCSDPRKCPPTSHGKGPEHGGWVGDEREKSDNKVDLGYNDVKKGVNVGAVGIKGVSKTDIKGVNKNDFQNGEVGVKIAREREDKSVFIKGSRDEAMKGDGEGKNVIGSRGESNHERRTKGDSVGYAGNKGTNEENNSARKGGDEGENSKKSMTGNKTNKNADARNLRGDSENIGSAEKGRGWRKGELPVLLWWSPISGQREGMARCGNVKCRVTMERLDKQWIKQPVKILIFYGTGLQGSDMPLPRRQDELWALVHEESPKNNDFLFSHDAILELFNYTSTFRRSSSFPMPTQWLRDPKTLEDTTFVVPTAEKTRLRKEESLAPVVYVHSDCGAPSDRDSFVQKLMQHVPVDSYGRCLHNKDLPARLTFQKSMSPMTSEEFYRLLARYKFVVAMENAVCEDYITEKLWRPLQLGVVPIAFGSPSLKDFLPSNRSALLVEELGSVAAVAKAVQTLDADDALYEQYVAFKKDGVSNSYLLDHLRQRSWGHGLRHHTHFTAYECFLCRKLHEQLERVSQGQPLVRSVATVDHYGCPKPLRFDSEGRYVEEDQGWNRLWRWSRALASAVRHFYDQGTVPRDEELTAKARTLEKDLP